MSKICSKESSHQTTNNEGVLQIFLTTLAHEMSNQCRF